MKVQKLDSGEMITIAYFIAIVIVLFVVYKFMAKIGLVKSRSKKLQEKAIATAESELRTLEYLDPMILENRPAAYVPLKSVAAGNFAAELRNAIRGLGTNEELIYSVFGRLKNKYNIAEVALSYRVNYNRDLKTDLLDELTDKEQVTLFELINKLPRL